MCGLVCVIETGGAFEVSQRMTAMIGWGATTKFKEKWVFDQVCTSVSLVCVYVCANCVC